MAGFEKDFQVNKMERRTFEWFERRRKTKGLDVAHEQIVKAVETVNLLDQAMKNFAAGNKDATDQNIKTLYKVEEKVDVLRAQVFTELSKSEMLMLDYREDLLHLVKRLDTVADNAKDAARCVEMLFEASLPEEMLKNATAMTTKLVACASTLQESLDNISANPAQAINYAHKVADIEHEIDKDYLSTKSLFVKYGTQTNIGTLVIFDDMIEFIEEASDLCADTADYTIILASRE
jgi:predicted phosphate transport protein (TIGR00153 family)